MNGTLYFVFKSAFYRCDSKYFNENIYIGRIFSKLNQKNFLFSWTACCLKLCILGGRKEYTNYLTCELWQYQWLVVFLGTLGQKAKRSFWSKIYLLYLLWLSDHFCTYLNTWLYLLSPCSQCTYWLLSSYAFE